MKQVIVLMSSYNGEKYICQQIDSILNQQGVIVKLIVRDDGSTDNTVDILNTYQLENKLSWYTGENLRPAKSFINLIDNAPDADYYALADQDDIWYPDKLYRAVSMIELENDKIPLLYAANQNCVDVEGKFTQAHFDRDMNYTLNINYVLMHNMLAGCTMVFNKVMMDVLRKETISREIAYMRMHDVWMMFCGLIHGKIIYDHQPVMDYRRHGNNVTNGAIESNIIVRYHTKLVNMLFTKGVRNMRSKTAKLLLNSFKDELNEKEKLDLMVIRNSVDSWKSRFELIKRRDLFLDMGEPLVASWLRVLLGRL